MQDPPEGLLNTDPGLHPQTFGFNRSGLRICFVTSSPETLARDHTLRTAGVEQRLSNFNMHSMSRGSYSQAGSAVNLFIYLLLCLLPEPSARMSGL